MNRLQRSHARVLAGALALCAGLWAPSVLAQQNSSVITGTVVDASTQQSVSDVVITATSAALQGEEVAVTDATGLYRLPQLPPGVYTLRFEKEGFQPYSRTEITLRLNRTIRLNAQLLPDEFQTTMEISGTPPAIDVGSTRTGVSVDTDLVRNLAVVRPGSKGSAARSFESLAELAPGANADAYGISLNGTTSPENGFLIDGLAAGNPSTGVLGSPISVEFIQEVNVITGGFMPEFGRSTGGVVTAITKSGSNEFRGSLFTNITPGALEHSPTPIAREGSVITTTQRLWNMGDFGGDLGGPIIKDKLWFYVGVAPSFTRRQLERNLNLFVLDKDGQYVKDENGFSRTQRIPGTTTHYFADQRSVQYIGKLTWQAAADHTLTLSVYGAPTTSGGNGRFAYRVDDNAVEVDNIAGAYSAYAHRNEQDSRDISLKLASSFLDKKVLLDATVGWHHQVDTNLASDGSPLGSTEGLSGVPQFEMQRTRLPGSPRTNYYSINDFEALPDPTVCEPAGTVGAIRCPVTTYLFGGPGFLLDRRVERYQGNVVATGLFTALGHHVFKAGFDAELMTNEDVRGYSGSVLYRENVNGQTFQDFRAFGYLTGPDEVVIQPSVNPSTRALAIGGFLQDSWSVMDKVTLNAGVRYDTQTVYGTGGNVAFELPNQISPRIGLIYDFTQQGRSKLYASFARYYQNAVLAMVNSQFSNITRIVATRNRAPQRNAQGDIIAPGCDPLTQAAPYTECRDEGNVATTGPAEQLSRKYTQTFAINSPVDPDLEPQSSDEWVVGADYEILPRATLGLSYTRRSMNSVIEDMSRNEATNYFIGNPGRGIASEFPKPVRNYNAMTISFNKAFSDLWLLQASYTWSRLWGNYSGLFRPENLQLAPNVTSDFDLISLTENKTGLLLLDRTHSVKLYGAKELPLSGNLSLNLGLSYRGTSGAPVNITGAHYIYGPEFTFILPRGAGGRLPFVHNIDTRLSASYRLSNDMVASVSMDVFNLFNFQAYTAVDQRYTADTVDAIVGGTKEDLEDLKPRGVTDRTVVVNPNFGKPTAYQPPRSIRLGARLSF